MPCSEKKALSWARRVKVRGRRHRGARACALPRRLPRPTAVSFFGGSPFFFDLALSVTLAATTRAVCNYFDA
jgi:hypothetical protein